MRIARISLTNYRQYRDAEIRIAANDPEKNIVIIQGNNGAGKTNLLNAVTWCLYGVESNIGEKTKGYVILNNAKANEMKENETAEVSVEIELVGKKDHMLIKRSQKFQKDKSGKINKIRHELSNQSDGSRLAVIRRTGKDNVLVGDPEFIIQRLIPKEIKQYFFFDGEKLDQYFRSDSSASIKAEVRRISQLDILDKVIDHLKKTIKNYATQNQELIPRISELIQEKEEKQKDLENLEKDLENIKNQIETAEKEIYRIEEELKRHDSEEVKRLTEERGRLEKELKEIENDLKILEKRKFAMIVETIPKVLTLKQLRKAEEIIYNAEDARIIPPLYTREFIEALINEGKCICGADLNADPSKMEALYKRLEEANPVSDLSIEITELKMKIKECINSIVQTKKTYQEYLEETYKKEKRHQEINERLKEISDFLMKGIEIDMVNELEVHLKDQKDTFRRLDQSMGAIKLKIHETKKYIEGLEKEIENEWKKKAKKDEVERLLEFSNKCLEEAERIKDEILNEIKEEIQKHTKELFSGFTWKKDTEYDVNIDDNYNVSVKDSHGNEQIGTLSAGERQMLALSFIAALNKCSGFDVPLIIDTPLARIGSEPRSMIVEHLPRFLKGKQIILLVLETEYTEEVRNILLPYLECEYRIKFNEDIYGNIAEVEKYEL